MNEVIVMMIYSHFEDYINYVILFNIYVEYNIIMRIKNNIIQN